MVEKRRIHEMAEKRGPNPTRSCFACHEPAKARDFVCLGVAAAPAYRKPWIAFARLALASCAVVALQEFTRSGFDEYSNHLN